MGHALIRASHKNKGSQDSLRSYERPLDQRSLAGKKVETIT